MSRAEHELAELRSGVPLSERRISITNEANPFLGDGYFASTATEILDGEASIEALMKSNSMKEEPSVVENDEEAAAAAGEVEEGGKAAEEEEEEKEDEFADPRVASITDRLKRIHKALIAGTGGGSREIGKAEFDNLSQVLSF